MRLDSAAIIVASVALSAGAQILLKSGMTDPKVLGTIEKGAAFDIALKVATSPMILGGLGAFLLSLVLWLIVLSRIPLSSAYPFVSLGILITVLAGFFIFAEPISLAKAIGVCLIVGGVVLVGAGS